MNARNRKKSTGSRTHHHSRSRGLSLIELLLVMSIVILVIGTYLTQLASARDLTARSGFSNDRHPAKLRLVQQAKQRNSQRRTSHGERADREHTVLAMSSDPQALNGERLMQ